MRKKESKLSIKHFKSLSLAGYVSILHEKNKHEWFKIKIYFFFVTLTFDWLHYTIFLAILIQIQTAHTEKHFKNFPWYGEGMIS